MTWFETRGIFQCPPAKTWQIFFSRIQMISAYNWDKCDGNHLSTPPAQQECHMAGWGGFFSGSTLYQFQYFTVLCANVSDTETSAMQPTTYNAEKPQHSFITYRILFFSHQKAKLTYTNEFIAKAQPRKPRVDEMFVPQWRGWTGRYLYCSSIHPNSPPAPALWHSRLCLELVLGQTDFWPRPVGTCDNCYLPVHHSPPIKDHDTHLICDISVHINSSSCYKAVLKKGIVHLTINYITARLLLCFLTAHSTIEYSNCYL